MSMFMMVKYYRIVEDIKKSKNITVDKEVFADGAYDNMLFLDV